MSITPESGRLVQVRGRPALVQSVVPQQSTDAAGLRHLVHIEYVDEHPYPRQDTVLWEVEPDIKVRKTQGWPDVRYSPPDNPSHYQAFTDAVRWTSLQSMEGFLLDGTNVPLVSPWSAAVQVEDYQLVPLLKALSMPRVSLLLADDVGLGKTIQAGLIATELMVRRGIRKILIVCPASLQHQWRQEMKEKFHLDFAVMDGDETRRIQVEHGSDVNPWSVHARAITSMDFLKQDLVREQFETAAHRREEELGAGRHPWDLLIVDEAHNLSPRRFGDDSMRTRMMRDLRFRFEHRLFLTATPHNGYVENFTGLLELLDPYRFVQKQEMTDLDRRHRDAIMVRRLKRQINEAGSTPRFPKRDPPFCVPIDYTPEEKAVWKALRAYRDSAYKRLASEGGQRANLGQFLFSLLMKRLLSSPYAFARTWWAHVAGGERVDAEDVDKARRRVEDETGDDAEQADRERSAAAQAGTWLFREAPALRDPADQVSAALRQLGWDEERTAKGPSAGADIPDAKWSAVLRHIREGAKIYDAPDLAPLVGSPTRPSTERLLLFTEYRDTQALILARLAAAGYKDETIRALYGGMGTAERDDIKELFNNPESKLRILVATDAASEGLNLQKRCRTVAHYDIPWNPMRLEQRNGRVDRHGQPAETVQIFHYNSREDEDDAFLARLIRKVDQAREDLGSVEAVIDNEIRDRLVLGRHQTKLQDWEAEIDATASPRDLLAGPPPEEEYFQAQRSFEAASKAYGLTPEAVENVVRWYLSRNKGATLRESPDGLEIVGARGQVKRLLDRYMPIPPRERGRPKLVFDPDAYLVQHGARLVYEPKFGTQLLRIGHPVAQAALQHYRRLVWNPMDGDMRRWTMQSIDGNEAYIGFDYLVTVRNQLQEVVHSRLDTTWFHVTGTGLRSAAGFTPPADLGAAPQDLDDWRERLGQAIASSGRVVQDLLKSVALNANEIWSEKMAAAKTHAREEFVANFNRQIKEMEAVGIDQHKQRLERLLTQAKAEASQSRLVASTRDLHLKRVRDLEDQLKPESLRVWARNQDTQVERLRKENDRFITHVLPKRYALRESADPMDVIEVVEAGIRALVPGGRA